MKTNIAWGAGALAAILVAVATTNYLKSAPSTSTLGGAATTTNTKKPLNAILAERGAKERERIANPQATDEPFVEPKDPVEIKILSELRADWAAQAANQKAQAAIDLKRIKLADPDEAWIRKQVQREAADQNFYLDRSYRSQLAVIKKETDLMKRQTAEKDLAAWKQERMDENRDYLVQYEKDLRKDKGLTE